MPRDILSGTILTPPPIYFPESNFCNTSLSIFEVISLSASIVIRISPLDTPAPLFRIRLKFRESSVMTLAPDSLAISPVLSVQQFSTTTCSTSSDTSFAATLTEQRHFFINSSSLWAGVITEIIYFYRTKKSAGDRRSLPIRCIGYLFLYVFYVQAIRSLRQFLIQCPDRYTRQYSGCNKMDINIAHPFSH